MIQIDDIVTFEMKGIRMYGCVTKFSENDFLTYSKIKYAHITAYYKSYMFLTNIPIDECKKIGRVTKWK